MKLSPTQREVLAILKHNGPQSARELGAQMRTLYVLRRYGYVASESDDNRTSLSDSLVWRITARGINEASA